jgi:proteasome lid subunit RPN8/RPN11
VLRGRRGARRRRRGGARAREPRHSPLRFEVDGLALHHLLTEIEDAGDTLGAIYHSHTRSAPYPSQTDINFAAAGPGRSGSSSGTKGDEPEVRSYLIDGGTVTEVPVEVA